MSYWNQVKAKVAAIKAPSTTPFTSSIQNVVAPPSPSAVSTAPSAGATKMGIGNLMEGMGGAGGAGGILSGGGLGGILSGGGLGGILGGGGGAGDIGGLLGGLGGGIGGISGLQQGLGGLFGRLPGGSTWNPLAPPKDRQNSTAEVQNVIDTYSAQNPYTSALDANGNLGAKYQTSAGPLVTADQLATPAAIAAKNIAATDVAAGTVSSKDVNAGKLDINSLTPDAAALNAIKAKALATGPSAWAKLALDQNNLDLLNNKDQAGAQALSGAATARNALAMRGGLGGGAAERIATNASRGMNADRQAAQRGAQGNALGIGMSDEQQKNALLTQIPGMDLAKSQYLAGLNQFNIGTDLDSQKFNSAQGLDAGKFNVGTALDASKFNSAQGLDASKYNSSAALDADKFNTGTAFDAAKSNAANNLSANSLNSNQVFGANQANAGAALSALGQQNAFNTGKFATQMAGYGAAKTADATANAGKK